jgi:hypothetical protein
LNTTTFSELRLTIGNNGNLTQEDGTATLNNLVVNGTSTGIERIVADEDATNAAFCVPFTADIDTGDNPPLNTRIGLDFSFNFNPFTNTLSVPYIIGNTGATGPAFTGDLSGTASKVLATSSVLNSNLPIPFLSASTGSVDILTDIVDGITYNPSTNNLTSTLFTGTVSNVNVSEVATNASFRVPFLSGATGSATISSDAGITYNPSTNILSCNVTGNLTGDVLGTTIDIGDPASTSEINIEGQSGCEINIGVAAFLNTINIGNQFASVNIKSTSNTSVMLFNPLDQMNGIF